MGLCGDVSPHRKMDEIGPAGPDKPLFVRLLVWMHMEYSLTRFPTY